MKYNPSLRGEKEIIVCEDGSLTLFSKEFDEPYHSTKDGALYESIEKYVKPSIRYQSHKESLTILDICFGLGYNTFATIYYIKKHKIHTKTEQDKLFQAVMGSIYSFKISKVDKQILSIRSKMTLAIQNENDDEWMDLMAQQVTLEQIKQIISKKMGR